MIYTHFRHEILAQGGRDGDKEEGWGVELQLYL